MPVTRLDKVVELTPGDNTITSLAAELQTKLQAAMPTTSDFVSSVVTVTKIGRLQAAIYNHWGYPCRHRQRNGDPDV